MSRVRAFIDWLVILLSPAIVCMIVVDGFSYFILKWVAATCVWAIMIVAMNIRAEARRAERRE